MTWKRTASLDDIAARISGADHIICTTHAKPDGDAMGSVLAVVRGLRASGHNVEGLLMGPVPAPLARLVGDTPLQVLDGDAQPEGSWPDLVVIVDTGAFSQLAPIEGWLREHPERIVVIDHHASGDEALTDVRYVDDSAASATVLVKELLEHMDVDLGRGDGSVAEALFAGLATDTGWFRQANADARAFRVASELLDRDVDKNRLYRLIEETARVQRLALLSRMLGSIEVIAKGRGAIMSLSGEDFESTGGRRDELTGLVNEPLVVDGIEFSVLMVEDGPGVVKLSMRSKPPRSREGAFVDVRALAGQMGGGGHVHASGAKVQGDLAQARSKVLQGLIAIGVEEA
ncbi:MAG: bifunctional oligoribonuclease/PAP phosphatase NrnA [Phycisphaerales bacterium]|nr:bifunctional oligoribonuclease/PAP phosphatase NrnA [Phycisphaerales bacterium]